MSIWVTLTPEEIEYCDAEAQLDKHRDPFGHKGYRLPLKEQRSLSTLSEVHSG